MNSGQSFVSLGLMKPTFKANKSITPAVWTPNSSKNLVPMSPKEINTQTLSNNQINILPPETRQTDKNINFDQQISSPTSSSFLSPLPSLNLKSPNLPIQSPLPYSVQKPIGQIPTISSPISGQKSIISSSPLPAPPPPPPPAEFSSSSPSVYPTRGQTDNQAQNDTNAAIEDRSIVEYPKKQSVASLRSKIELKLNGSAPVRGYMTAAGQIIKPEPPKNPHQPLNIPRGLFKAELFDSNDTSEPKIDFTSENGKSIKYTDRNMENAPKIPTNLPLDIQTDETSSAFKPISMHNLDLSTNLSAIGSAIDNLQNAVYGAKNILIEQHHETTKFGEKFPVNPEKSSEILEHKPAQSRIYPIAEKMRAEKAKFLGIEHENQSIKTNGDFSLNSPVPPRIPPPPETYEYSTINQQSIYKNPNEVFDDKDDQRMWYKKMYNKIHHVDRKDNESVLRYQLKDYLPEKISPSGAYSPYMRRQMKDQESDTKMIKYKFGDYAKDHSLSYEPGYLPKATSAYPDSYSKDQSYYPDYATQSRRLRSKSASRFENNNQFSPPPSDVVKSTMPGERYKHQPKKIEDYIPGTSSVADYEQEKNRYTMDNTRSHSAMAFSAPPTRLFSPIRNSNNMNRGAFNRSPFRPPKDFVEQHFDAKHQYKSMQMGGDVPLNGLNQLAPEALVSQSVAKDESREKFSHTENSIQAGKMPAQDFFELAKLERELVIENERRKKLEREQEDQRSRRHGYVPIKIETPIMNDNRFDKFLNDYGKRDRFEFSPQQQQPSPDFRGVARALYAFTAHTPRELSFFKGDLIKIRSIIDANWYEGDINGRVGIIPANYVELLAAAGGEERVMLTEVSRTREGQAQALYNFDGRGMNELPLRKNEIVNLIKKIDDHWYEGRNELARRGLVPASYLRVFHEPNSQLKDFVSAVPSENLSSAGSSNLQSVSNNDFKLQVNGVTFGKQEQPGQSSYGPPGKFPVHGADRSSAADSDQTTYRTVYSSPPKAATFDLSPPSAATTAGGGNTTYYQKSFLRSPTADNTSTYYKRYV